MPRVLRVLFVSSDRQKCGIREYGEYLMDALVEKHKEEISVLPYNNPDAHTLGLPDCDILHINHHAALHANWTKELVEEYRKQGLVVCVTQHDTFEKFSIMQERGFQDFRKADGLVVHEPVEGLTDAGLENVYWFNQGVLPSAQREDRIVKFSQYTLGTVGFDLPWKNFELGARVTKAAGWSYVVVSQGMSEERVNELQAINPRTAVLKEWHNAKTVVGILSACAATGFFYSTGNSGTSGAIRLGIAARKPMVAFASRQNKDLQGEKAIRWVSGEEEVVEALREIEASKTPGLEVLGMEVLASRDSWENLAEKYKNMWIDSWKRR